MPPVFSIRLYGDPFSQDGEIVQLGILEGMNFQEVFRVPLTYWSADEYVHQWSAALRELLTRERTAVALVTAMREPSSQNFVFRWVLYRESADIYLQENLLIAEALGIALDEHVALSVIGSRMAVGEDGQTISEWKFSVDDIEQFVSKSS